MAASLGAPAAAPQTHAPSFTTTTRTVAVYATVTNACMGMSEFYGARNDEESAATILRALELGITLLDTADAYGIGDNEELIGKTIRGRRDEVFVATKFATCG